MLLASHSIHLPAFQGPLDLLLQLIERDELDITAISLVQVTDQYLAIIEEMGRQGIADLTAFLVVAARLVLIKSRALLPGQPAPTEEEEDVAADLIQQLEAYRRFKEAAQELAWREEGGLRSYVRVGAPQAVPASFELDGLTMEGLLAAAQEAFGMLPAAPVETVIAQVAVTIADQIERIRERLGRRERFLFHEMLSAAASRVEVIVTLLAVLELLKQGLVSVRQEGLFGPITIEPPPEPAAAAEATPL